MFSSREVRLPDERARKNAKMAPFNSNGGGWEIRFEQSENESRFLMMHRKMHGGGWEIRTPAPDHSRLTI